MVLNVNLDTGPGLGKKNSEKKNDFGAEKLEVSEKAKKKKEFRASKVRVFFSRFLKKWSSEGPESDKKKARRPKVNS